MHVKRRNGVKLLFLIRLVSFFLLFFLCFCYFLSRLLIKHAMAWQLWSGRMITLGKPVYIVFENTNANANVGIYLCYQRMKEKTLQCRHILN